MQAVDGLDGGRRVLERRLGEGALGDVHEQAEAVRDVLVQGSLETEIDHAADRGRSSSTGRARHPDQRSSCGYELPQRRHDLQRAVGLTGELHERSVVDPAHHPGPSRDQVRDVLVSGCVPI